ncbi:MAG: DNA polymerase [Patescibacteria group bacterium]
MKKNSKYSKRTILLDAHAIIHRAYHALPDFTTRDGSPTGGLYGVCTMLLKIIEELQPDYIIACYDLPEPTFRHAAYEEYKGTRSETEDALKEQLSTSKKIFESFNIPIYEYPGYEADDVLGTLARQISQRSDHQVIIASGDLDTLQLVNTDQVQVYTLKKGITDTILYDEEAVQDRYGFDSDLIPDYKGLAGDSSDNIKGIPGIGDKTARMLITSFGSIESIYEQLKNNPSSFDEAGIKPRIQKLLREHEEDARFSKELATIYTKVPISYKTTDYTLREGIDMAQIDDLFRRLEFRTLHQRLQKILGLENTEDIASEENIDSRRLKEALLGVYLLNPIISEPVLDDVLRYGDDFDTAYGEIEKAIKDHDLEFVWREIECPIIEVVEQMNNTGLLIDIERLDELSQKFHAQEAELEKRIYKHAGETFNIKSTKQLAHILFDVLDLPTKGIKKTPTGNISTKESELSKLQGVHPIIDDILEYRELTKLTSTYLDNIKPMIDPRTNRLHTTFIQSGTTTGRMSSRDPNLQNIPTGGTYGKEIRTMFIAQKGYRLLSCDYSQIELRVAAELSRDEKLLQFFRDGQDIHRAVAREMFGDETAENRRKAKIINFGILYGMGARALRSNLGIDEYTARDAEEYLEKYFDRFPTLASYLESSKESARKHKYSRTLFGRIRYFSDIDSKVPFIRAAAERMAVNAPIQGTATADIIKLALKDIYTYLKKNELLNCVHILAQVHDELIFEVDTSIIEKEQETITQIMERVLDTYAPQVGVTPAISLVVDSHQGDTWAQVK